MHHIPRALFDVLIIISMVAIFIGIGTAFTVSSNAKDYKADVIAEIENSNFNDTVINECIQQATDNGYTLTINKIITDPDENKQIAEVILGYQFKIGILEIDDWHYTRGVAR